MGSDIPDAYFVQEIARSHLGDHSCLSFEDMSRQMMGGPVRADGDCQCKLSMSFKGMDEPLIIQSSGCRLNCGLLARERLCGRRCAKPHSE